MSRGNQGAKLAVRRRTNSADRPSLLSVSSLKPRLDECGGTHAPLRVNDCQFALGFESANLRKNRRPQRRRSALASGCVYPAPQSIGIATRDQASRRLAAAGHAILFRRYARTAG
jgi:hypothetical protein